MRKKEQDKLDRWLRSDDRKPLVLRGARQVGKTWLVRDLAARHKLDLVELNLERNPRLAQHFESNDPRQILENLEAEFSRRFSSSRSLLFLDEIQATPELLGTLRWFMEELPSLAVIAAGSLLDFALQKHEFSMPVGRITYAYIEPVSFLGFLQASGNTPLYEHLSNATMDNPPATSLHDKCLQFYFEYSLVGGMPAVVAKWFTTRDFSECLKLQQDLLTTYQDDFSKYSKKADVRLLVKIIDSAARQLGNKFVASRVEAGVRAAEIKSALSLLASARVLSFVRHTSGNGIPMGAESNDKFYKILFLDTGLVSALLHLSQLNINEVKAQLFKSKGPLAEQFVGQQLRAALSQLEDPALFYWQRTDGRQGEIDYLIQHGNKIVPIEVKSGASGAMKSLHQFMHDKNLDLAIRCDLNPMSISNIKVKTTTGKAVCYKLFSVPLYLAERIPDILQRAILK
ncbi:MAG: DUF4143 domain-containing protein [Xanthomonadales bacterium]|nr:DUF4143 domain-containing protein [Xanthomonadales bacterium]